MQWCLLFISIVRYIVIDNFYSILFHKKYIYIYIYIYKSHKQAKNSLVLHHLAPVKNW